MNLKKDAPIALLAYQLLKDLQKEKIDSENYILRFDIALVIKYKISYFEKQPNGNLKDVLTDELLVKIGFNVEYASQDSAQIDIDKKNPSEIKNKLKEK